MTSTVGLDKPSADPSSPDEASPASGSMRPRARTGVRVLVVDDDPIILKALCTMLRKHGFRVFPAESGEAGLAVASEFALDVAICDRNMPGMDGIELLEHLQRLQPMCWRVLLTGGLDLSTTISAVNRGSVNRVLEKPVRTRALVSVVHEALDSRDKLVEAYRELEREDKSAEKQLVSTVLSSEHLQLAFQPVVDAKTGAVFGYEALLRSSHATLNGPGSVLQAVERHSLVDGLADVVVDRARSWFESSLSRGEDGSEPHLFMNLHPRELGNPDALRERLVVLAPFAHRVILEVTERSSIYGVSAWEQSVEVMRSMGFEIAVDDLGAGYSALAVLAELKPRFIKVDMSIIRDADRQIHKQRLLDLLCRFADATDSKLVAEGIETKGEADTVRACGAHLLQGYYFGRPRLPAHLQLVTPDRKTGAA